MLEVGVPVKGALCDDDAEADEVPGGNGGGGTFCTFHCCGA